MSTKSQDNVLNSEDIKTTRRRLLQASAVSAGVAGSGGASLAYSTDTAQAQFLRNAQQGWSDLFTGVYTWTATNGAETLPLIDEDQLENSEISATNIHLQMFQQSLIVSDNYQNYLKESSTVFSNDEFALALKKTKYETIRQINSYESESEMPVVGNRSDAKEDIFEYTDTTIRPFVRSIWRDQASLVTSVENVDDTILSLKQEPDVTLSLNFTDLFRVELENGDTYEIESYKTTVDSEATIWGSEAEEEQNVVSMEVTASDGNDYRVTHYPQYDNDAINSNVAKLYAIPPQDVNSQFINYSNYENISPEDKVYLLDGISFRDDVDQKMTSFREGVRTQVEPVIDDMFSRYVPDEITVEDLKDPAYTASQSATGFNSTGNSIYASSLAASLGYETSVTGQFEIKYEEYITEGDVQVSSVDFGNSSRGVVQDAEQSHIFYAFLEKEIQTIDTKTGTVKSETLVSGSNLRIREISRIRGENQVLVFIDGEYGITSAFFYDIGSMTKINSFSYSETENPQVAHIRDDRFLVSETGYNQASKFHIVDTAGNIAKRQDDFEYFKDNDVFSSTWNANVGSTLYTPSADGIYVYDGGSDTISNQPLDITVGSVYDDPHNPDQILVATPEYVLYRLDPSDYSTTQIADLSSLFTDPNRNQIGDIVQYSTVDSEESEENLYVAGLSGEASFKYITFSDGSTEPTTHGDQGYDGFMSLHRFSDDGDVKYVSYADDRTRLLEVRPTGYFRYSYSSVTSDGLALDSDNNPKYKEPETLTGSLYTDANLEETHLADKFAVGDVIISPNNLSNYDGSEYEFPSWVAFVLNTRNGESASGKLKLAGRAEITNVTNLDGDTVSSTDENGNPAVSANEQTKFGTTTTNNMRQQVEDYEEAQQDYNEARQKAKETANTSGGGGVGGGGFFSNIPRWVYAIPLIGSVLAFLAVIAE